MNTEETKTEITVYVEAIHHLYKRGEIILYMPKKGCTLAGIRTYLHKNPNKIVELGTALEKIVVEELTILEKVGKPSLVEQAQAAWLASGEDDARYRSIWISGWIAGQA